MVFIMYLKTFHSILIGHPLMSTENIEMSKIVYSGSPEDI